MQKIEILVVDDEQEMLVSYKKILEKSGYSVTTAESAAEALKRLDKNHNFLLVICDLKMPEMDGMEFLSIVKQKHTYLPVIMVTGFGTLDLGIEAVKRGAFDFIEKPFTSEKLLKSIKEAVGKISFSDADSQTTAGFDNIVGQSSGMRQIFDMIKKVAYGNSSVLITGESGTGKELVARSIHKHSLRRNHPLIPINCGALPNSLFESELFGYEKGAFTGAFQSKPGLVELATGGTLFLDEVSETPNDLQVKLLRMLEDRKIRRIGGKEEIPIDIRVISATNLNIEEALQKKLLREDLFFRINTINIHIPPLRDRFNDIPILVSHFLTDLNEKYNRGITDIEPEVMELMQGYEWPGNVRELQNIIERIYFLANPPTIRVSDLPSYLNSQNHKKKAKNWDNLSYRKAKEMVQDEFEREYLNYQLNKYDWNISRTAKECGIDRRTIHRLINKFDLKKS